MANIQERTTATGEKRFCVLIRKKGYPPQSATFKRKTDAAKWARQTEAAMEEGRHFKTTETKKRTIADLIDRYIQDVLPSKSPEWQKIQASQLRWWRAEIGTYSLANLTPALISESRDKLAAGSTHQSEKRSPATVTRYIAALSHACTVAVQDWQWLDENPVSKIRKPPETQGRVRFLNDGEKVALLNACKASQNTALYPVVLLALHTGMRQSELLGLTWADVDFTRERITLQRTKNGEPRGLPLKGEALEVIRAWAKIRRIDTNLLFPSRKDSQTPIDIRWPWEHAAQAAGLEDFRFHDLRHTAASYLAMNGASLLEIAEVLGHKTLQMVRRYAHLADSHTASVVERMNQKMFG